MYAAKRQIPEDDDFFYEKPSESDVLSYPTGENNSELSPDGDRDSAMDKFGNKSK